MTSILLMTSSTGRQRNASGEVWWTFPRSTHARDCASIVQVVVLVVWSFLSCGIAAVRIEP